MGGERSSTIFLLSITSSNAVSVEHLRGFSQAQQRKMDLALDEHKFSPVTCLHAVEI